MEEPLFGFGGISFFEDLQSLGEQSIFARGNHGSLFEYLLFVIFLLINVIACIGMACYQVYKSIKKKETVDQNISYEEKGQRLYINNQINEIVQQKIKEIFFLKNLKLFKFEKKNNREIHLKFLNRNGEKLKNIFGSAMTNYNFICEENGVEIIKKNNEFFLKTEPNVIKQRTNFTSNYEITFTLHSYCKIFIPKQEDLEKEINDIINDDLNKEWKRILNNN